MGCRRCCSGSGACSGARARARRAPSAGAVGAAAPASGTALGAARPGRPSSSGRAMRWGSGGGARRQAAAATRSARSSGCRSCGVRRASPRPSSSARRPRSWPSSSAGGTGARAKAPSLASPAMGYGSAQRRRSLAAARGGAAARACLVLLGCWPTPPRQSATPRAGRRGTPLEATIRRDSHGIPHILADDFGGHRLRLRLRLRPGQHLHDRRDLRDGPRRALALLRRGQGTFGPDGSYPQRGNGFSGQQPQLRLLLPADHRQRDRSRTCSTSRRRTGPRAEIREGVRGYVAGYNKYLADTGVDNLPDPRCRGADWVKPITEIDAYRRFYQLALLASQSVAIDGIAGEKTPRRRRRSPIDPTAIAERLERGAARARRDRLQRLRARRGGDRQRQGHGARQPALPLGRARALLPVPPHHPGRAQRLRRQPLRRAAGPDRPHRQPRLEPHRLDRLPLHARSRRPLVPGSTRRTYLYDGQFRDMERGRGDGAGARPPAASSRGPGRSTRPTTARSSTTSSACRCPGRRRPPSRWATPTPTNFRYLNHFFVVEPGAERRRARRDREDATRASPGSTRSPPTRAGKAYYADIGAIPNVSERRRPPTCNTPVGAATFAALGLPVLDGTRSACEWDNDPDAVAPGHLRPRATCRRSSATTTSPTPTTATGSRTPRSRWRASPGSSATSDAERSLRTRLGLKMHRAAARRHRRAGRRPNRSPARTLQDVVFNNRQYAGELWRDQLVDALRDARPAGMLLGSSGGPVDVSGACPVLAAWDVHDDLDSNGAILFRRFASRAARHPAACRSVCRPATRPSTRPPSTPTDPVNTPNGLNTASPKVAAVAGRRGHRPRATPASRSTRRCAATSTRSAATSRSRSTAAPATLGVFNAINVSWSPRARRARLPERPPRLELRDGHPVHRAAARDDRSILTYSQSDEPELALLRGPDRMFSNKEWVDPPFCEARCGRARAWSTTTISGCLPGGCGAGGRSGPDARRREAAPKKCKKRKKRKAKTRQAQALQDEKRTERRGGRPQAAPPSSRPTHCA